MRCGWCGTDGVAGATHCALCGGPLGSGVDAGPRPPDAPRELPRLFLRREYVTRNAGLWFGLLWCVLTGVFPVIFGILSCSNPVMLPAAIGSLVFPLPGVVIGALSLRGARRRVAVLREGRLAIGTIDAAGPDGSVTVNDAHPWKIQYVFEADGRRLGGSVSTFDASAREFPVGTEIHVVYLPGEPERNDVWPPFYR